MKGTANKEEQNAWGIMQKNRIEKLLALPEESLFNLTYVEIPQMEKARIFNTVICYKCQEPLSEARAYLEEGRIVCADCINGYTRGW